MLSARSCCAQARNHESAHLRRRSNSNSDSTPDELLPDPVCVGVLAQLDPLGPLMKTDDELMVLAPERIKAEVQLAAALDQPVRRIV